MILSASSSISFSQSLMCCSMWACRSAERWSCSVALASLSKSFTANHLCCSFGTRVSMDSSMWAMACSTLPVKTWGSSPFSLAAWAMASSAAFLVLSECRALISIVSQPSSFPSFAVSILSPFLRTRSIMLKAMTTGMPISTSWVVRYRFLSMLVPSTMFRMTSGFSLTR